MQEPVPLDPAEEPKPASQPGGAARAEGDLQGLRQAAERSPDDAEAHYLLGQALADQDRLREAVPALQQAIRLKADHVPALVLLGRTLIGLGKSAPGKAALQAALQRTPNVYARQFALGNMLRAAGFEAEALAAFDAALQSGSETASLQYNRGVCLRALNRIEEAVAAYQRAVELDPDHPKAHNNLGNCLRRLEKYAAAERALRRAVELTPDWFAPYYGLARVLDKRQRPGEAVVAFRRALRLNPQYKEAHVQLGVVLQEIGQLDAARQSYRRAIEIDPAYPGAHAVLAQLDREPLDPSVLERLETKLASGKCSAMDRQHLHFGLAQRYDQIQEFGRAFDHLVEGNRLKRAEIEYDIKEDVRQFRKIMRGFDRDFFLRHSASGDPSPLPIFIVGMPRSGTTLIEQILASHSGVHGAGEINFLGKAAYSTMKAAWSKDGDVVARAYAPDALLEVAQAYLKQVRALAPNPTRVVDKFLTNFKYIGLIKLLLPNAHVIHARRHPLDNCLSVFRKLFAGGLAFSYDLAELGTYYVNYAKLMRHWHEVLPGFVLDVQYEEMIEDQRGMTERILAHCGLDWEDSCLQFYETQRAVRTASVSQVRQPIYRSSAGIWKRYGERLRPLIDVLGEELDPAELAEWSEQAS